MGQKLVQRRGMPVEGVQGESPGRDPKAGAANIGQRKARPRHAGAAGHQPIELPGAVDEAPEQDQPDAIAAEETVETGEPSPAHPTLSSKRRPPLRPIR
jgi:hypothetical protein